MEKGKEPANDFAGREFAITRLLDAPRELVWEVVTKPEHINNWWGPHGFSTTGNKMEVKPGGTWEFVMHAPDGVDYPAKNIFIEVIKPERIVMEVSLPKSITTATFTAVGKKTLLTWHMLFESKEAFERSGADEGLKQTIDKLEKYVVAQK